ncbi:MAG TPA: 1,4-dihydroxy-2-naphthoate polyprenyltransferase [Mycobacteriales bacterium]|nr:1,4-dihydroxy-2-naphthoate polyprenyltransferase [Mycobacteriales bacterium]
MSKSEKAPEQPAGLAAWVAGARPRTLPASVVPVIVGTGVAAAHGSVVWWRAVIALVVSLALQIGVNYANDYSDGVRGTDSDRVGPLRLTASGTATPRAVFTAAMSSFGVAGVAGLVLAASTSWWLLLVGAASIAAAWFYTGGSSPYGYRALGDVSVFVFFGLVAVVGTAFVASRHPAVTWLAIACAVPCGLLAVAVLVANNLRDIPRDAQTDKQTLAVLLGDRRTRLMYLACIVVPFLVTIVLVVDRPWAAVALVAAPLALAPTRQVMRGASGRDLIAVLGATGRLQLGYGVLLAIGLAL